MFLVFTIVVSKPNAASMNIAQRFIENFEWNKTGKIFDGEPIRKHGNLELVFTDTLHVFADNVDSISTDFFVFVSSHKSAAGKPSLTCHPIGNWGKAELGGKDKSLVPTSAFLLRNYLLKLEEKKQQQNLAFEVTLECTHHGPFLPKPTVFIELGSSEAQWNDKKAALALAETVIEATSTNCGSSVLPVIGIGGTHYCSEFSKLVLRKPFAFSHVCPEYALANLNDEMLQQAIDCSVEKPQMIVIDWKGLGKEKLRILSLLEKQSLPVERVQNLLK